MTDPLAHLVADGVIDDARSRLKSGKEADLWIVRHGGEVVAAKVYKARETRSFHNNAGYKEGRRVRNTRTQRAMDRGSRFGQAAAEDAWKAKEADALHALHAAGVRVPRPVLYYEGVLLMELVVDANGHPAPRLIDAHVGRPEAAALYADLRGQAVRMLTCDIVHGDLSPYNVLLAWNGPTVIDFPQVVGAAHNSQAEGFFRRDLENLRRFFAALDPALHAASNDAQEIWRAYVRRELTPEFVPSGRPAEPHRQRGSHPSPSQSHTNHAAPSQGHAAPPPSQSHAAHGHPDRGPGGRGQHGHGRGEQQHPRSGGAPQFPKGRQRGRGAPDRPASSGPEVVRVGRPGPDGRPAGQPQAHHVRDAQQGPPPQTGNKEGAPGSGRRRRRGRRPR